MVNACFCLFHILRMKIYDKEIIMHITFYPEKTEYGYLYNFFLLNYNTGEKNYFYKQNMMKKII